MRLHHRLILILLIALSTTSCGRMRMLYLSQQVELIEIEKIVPKGFTSLQLVAEVSNSSRHDIAMEEGVIEILSETGETIATLKQIGNVESPAASHESIKSLWRISNIDPLLMITLSSRIATNDLDGLYVNYSARLSAGNITRTISGKEVDIKKLLAIFAS